jgi:hypothetical protein
MNDGRTPDQVSTDDALTAAIEAHNRAYYPDQPAALLTDYMVVFVDQSFDEDGDTTTGIGTAPRDGDLPLYRQIGMLEHALTRARQRICEGQSL